MASKVEIIRDEINNDPLVRGYVLMGHQEVADDINSVYREAPDRQSISGPEIFNAIVPSEFSALSSQLKQFVRDVFSLGDAVDIRENTNARTVLLNAFDSNSTTRSNLADLITQQQSRASELGISPVKHTDVYKARNP